MKRIIYECINEGIYLAGQGEDDGRKILKKAQAIWF